MLYHVIFIFIEITPKFVAFLVGYLNGYCIDGCHFISNVLKIIVIYFCFPGCRDSSHCS